MKYSILGAHRTNMMRDNETERLARQKEICGWRAQSDSLINCLYLVSLEKKKTQKCSSGNLCVVDGRRDFLRDSYRYLCRSGGLVYKNLFFGC